MTIGVDSQTFESYVNVYDAIPSKWEDARPFIVEQLKNISNGVNIRTIGWYLDVELLSGNQFIPGVTAPGNNPGTTRSILRKVIDFGALPAAGTKSVPHGIQFDANFTLMHMYAAATDPINFIAIPIPWAEAILPIGNIQISLNAANVNISVQSNRSNFTRCFVVIEYIQEL